MLELIGSEESLSLSLDENDYRPLKIEEKSSKIDIYSLIRRQIRNFYYKLFGEDVCKMQEVIDSVEDSNLYTQDLLEARYIDRVRDERVIKRLGMLSREHPNLVDAKKFIYQNSLIYKILRYFPFLKPFFKEPDFSHSRNYIRKKNPLCCYSKDQIQTMIKARKRYQYDKENNKEESDVFYIALASLDEAKRREKENNLFEVKDINACVKVFTDSYRKGGKYEYCVIFVEKLKRMDQFKSKSNKFFSNFCMSFIRYMFLDTLKHLKYFDVLARQEED